MLSMAIDFTSLLLASLLVGAMFGVWLIFNPVGLEPAVYTTLLQQGIRTMNVTMPLLGMATILATTAAAVLARGNGGRLSLLVAAVACFVAARLVTRFLNQPINAIVMAWSVDSPPADWTRFRDEWRRWHMLRSAIGIAGLCLLIAATLDRAASA